MLHWRMTYSVDYRRRVISFVNEGGSKLEAARLFKVNHNTIYAWLQRGEDLSPRPAKTRRRKLCKETLAQHVKFCPDALLRERAIHFNVHPSTVFYALRRMKIVKKRA